MASARVPGTTCVTQQQPIDFRTSQLAAAPPQGPVGADVYDSRFDANEIQSLEMFEASLKHRSLEELQYLRAKTEYLYEDAVRAYGAQSRAAAFAAASVAVVDNRITFLQSRSGKQKGRLQELIDAMHEGKAVKDAEVRKAIRDLLAAERNKPESDAPSGNESGSAMAVVVEAVKEVSRIKNRQFKELLERAKRPGAHVPDEHIKHELQKVLGVERQKQLLGIDDGNTMDLVAEAIDFSHTRRKSELRRLIDRANSGTHKPTREQVRAQIVKVLQTERERQLLGISDPDKDQSTDELINEARNAMSTVHVTIGPVTLERK